MKIILIFLLTFFVATAYNSKVNDSKANAKQTNQSAINYFTFSDDEFCDAIYIAEGGKRAKKPYGILSVQCNTEQQCRRICKNTVSNNRKRFKRQDKYKNFLFFLADRYCPKDVDRIGNRNWKKNVKFYLLKNRR